VALSRQVRCGKSPPVWMTYPARRRIDISEAGVTATPPTFNTPWGEPVGAESGKTSPRTSLSRVDLPQPLGPTTAVVVPPSQWSESPRTARTPRDFFPPRVTFTSRSSTSGPGIADHTEPDSGCRPLSRNTLAGSAALAQLVELRFCKPKVAGSSPAGGFFLSTLPCHHPEHSVGDVYRGGGGGASNAMTI
jgi:hypothetical protein